MGPSQDAKLINEACIALTVHPKEVILGAHSVWKTALECQITEPESSFTK